LSDERFKKNIDEDVLVLDFIMRLRPVTYNLEVNKLASYLKEDEHANTSGSKAYLAPDDFTQQSRNAKEQIRYSGFVAQEVEMAAAESGYDFSGVSRPQNDDDLYGLKYSQFVVPLVKAVQELNAIIEAQKISNEELKALNAELVKRIEKLESR
jgi:trimeric autotransporter adhesin